MSEKTAAVGKSVGDAAATTGVLIKLSIFTLALGIVPLSSYFASQKYIWEGNSTYAAITAVISANAVLVAYIVTSLLEDRQPTSTVPAPIQSEKKRQ